MKNISMKSTQLIEDSYTNYHHSVYLYIYYRIAHKEEAEDLAQDVYVRLMDYDRMLCAETIKYFIFTIARNLVTDYLRRYYKRQEVTSYLYEHTVAYTNETELRVVANDLEACEKYRLSLLPPRRRTIYAMSRFEDKNIRNNININLKMFFITLCIFGTSCLSNNANIVKREYIFPIKKRKNHHPLLICCMKKKG
jgi:DNA-directed RNA polymerase specialized sigma24 family protein